MSKSPNRVLGIVFGALYILLGILGFTVTSGIGFFTTEGGLLLGVFEVNVFHNVAHIIIGAALLLAGLSNANAARTINSVIGGAYLLLGLAGLFLVGTALNILALNVADNVLHFASAAILLAVGLGADRRARAASA
ncbi:hypothetical protein BH11ACT4_BH11ACT4_10150 [soil metagenome]